MGTGSAASRLLVHVGEHGELVREATAELGSGRDVSVTTADSVAAGARIDDADCLLYGPGDELPVATVDDRAVSVPWFVLTETSADVDSALRAGASDVFVRRGDVPNAELLARRLDHVLFAGGSETDDSDGDVTPTDELRQERDFTELLLDTLDDVFYLVGPDRTLERWNESLKTVTGYTDEELAGMDALDLFEGADRRRIREAIAGSLESGSATVEANFVTKNGDSIPYDFTGAKLTAPDGELRGLVGIGRDVSERKELEQELRRKASLLDHIFNQVPTALYVKDTEGRHVRMSEFHSDAGGTLGKTDPEIYGETEYTQSTFADDMRVIEEGDRIINQEEYNPRTDEWTLTSKVPWRDENGNVQGLIGVSRLITEKKEYERKLNVRNRAMAEAPVGISIHDADDLERIVYVNDEFESLTGYDGQTVDGEGFPALAGAETNPDVFETLESAFENGESASLVVLLYRADGDPFWGRIAVAPVTNDDDELTHFVGFLQDVTDSKEHAEEIERRLDEFGEVIAEELQAPLRDAEEAIEELRGNGSAPSVETAVRSIQRADKLIDDLAAVHSFSVKSRDVFDTGSGKPGGDE